MSLINDALKKAQHRHGESTPPNPGQAGPAAIPSRPGKGKTPLTKMILIGAGIGAFSAAVSTAVILFVLRKDPPAQSTPPIAGPAPVTQPATPVSAPSVAPTPVQPVGTPSTAPTFTAAPVTAATEPPAASPFTTSAEPAPAVTPVAPVSLPEPAPTIKLGTRVQAFVDRLRVTSIRISDTGNKAILNDRLFRVNDLVEPSLGLRLTDIQPSVLTFTDESGNTYLRHF